MSQISDIVERLAHLTESNVSAVTTLDAPRVGLLARERADLMFELRIRLQNDPGSRDLDRERTRAASERLARAEHRLDRALKSLLRVLEPPSSCPTIYGRTGKILEVSRA